jgi:chromate transporter
MKLIFELFSAFLKIGTFTFGGGLAMLPLIRETTVEKKGWMTESEMVDCLAISQSLPGMLAVNASILVGYRKKALAGSIAAALGVILPAYVSIVVILLFLGKIEENSYVQGAFEGIKAASAALIALAAWQMGKQVLKGKLEYFIAGVSFLIIVFAGVSGTGSAALPWDCKWQPFRLRSVVWSPLPRVAPWADECEPFRLFPFPRQTYPNLL